MNKSYLSDKSKPELNGLSIIICCYNSIKRLPQTLNYLKRQKIANYIKWEVVVVDNGKNEDLRKLCDSIWTNCVNGPLIIVEEKRTGLSFARQCGIVVSRYNILCFIDDDNWVDENWIQTVYWLMKKYPEIGACGGSSEPVFGAPPPDWFDRFKTSYAVGTQGSNCGEVEWKRNFLWGAGLIIRKKALLDLVNHGFKPWLTGRYGEKLMSGEDSELCFALRLAKWTLWYCPNLKLKHFIPKKRLSWQYLRRLHFGFGASAAILHIYTETLGVRACSMKKMSTGGWKNEIWSIVQQGWQIKHKILQYLFSKNTEGDGDILDIERMFGEIIELVKNRKNYELWSSSIRNANWNRTTQS